MEAKLVYNRNHEILAVIDENFMAWYRADDIFKVLHDVDRVPCLGLIDEDDITNIKLSDGTIHIFIDTYAVHCVMHLSDLPSKKEFGRWIYSDASIDLVSIANNIRVTEITEKISIFKLSVKDGDKAKLRSNFHHAIDLLSPSSVNISKYEKQCAWNYLSTFLKSCNFETIEILNPNNIIDNEKILYAAYTHLKHGIDLMFKESTCEHNWNTDGKLGYRCLKCGAHPADTASNK